MTRLVAAAQNLLSAVVYLVRLGGDRVEDWQGGRTRSYNASHPPPGHRDGDRWVARHDRGEL